MNNQLIFSKSKVYFLLNTALIWIIKCVDSQS